MGHAPRRVGDTVSLRVAVAKARDASILWGQTAKRIGRAVILGSLPACDVAIESG
jgi:hypothetical protein